MSLNEIVKTMQDAVNRQTDQAKPGGYDTTATVRRIEGDTAFVHIPGGVDETPVKLTINAKAGDNVQVRVSGGSAFLVGNGSSPPTDDARANQAYTVATVAEGAAENALANAARAAEAADSAQASATRAESAAGDAVIAAGNAQTAAASAQTAADTALVSLSTVEDVVGVLNWITEHGTMTLTSDVTVNPAHVYFIVDPAGDYVVGGTHYSIVSDPKDADLSTYYELTVDESVENYVATHVAVDSEGLWLIPEDNATPASSGKKILIATGAGSTYTTAGTYIIEKVGGVDTVLAEFTASGSVIGDAAGAHTVIDNDGMQIYSVDSLANVINLANIGYGPGTDSGGGTSYAPYYTFGRRITGSEGNYSVAEGYFSRADGYASHAEGTASVDSNSFCGHAEGSTTYVLAPCGHAEGISSTVRGDYAHAQNNGTYADRRSHTVIGEYNIRDQAGANGTVRGDYAVIVGNGTADNARSNAATVDWSGNIDIASGAKYKINGTALSASDVGALAEDANGDISITRNITAGGNVEAAGDVTADGNSILDALYFKPNDTYVAVGRHAGICTSGSAQMQFTLVLPKSAKYCSGFTVTGIVGGVRISTGGYADNVTDGTSWSGRSGISFGGGLYNADGTSHTSGDGKDAYMCTINLSKTSAFKQNGTTTNVVNNTPVTLGGNISIKFT